MEPPGCRDQTSLARFLRFFRTEDYYIYLYFLLVMGAELDAEIDFGYPCPHCKSERTRSLAINRGSELWKCDDCGENFLLSKEHLWRWRARRLRGY